MMNLDEYRQQSLESWEKMSAGWHSWRDFLYEQTASVREWLVSNLDPKAGHTILDVAAGAGDTGYAALAKIAPDGTLITTDFAPKMVDVARTRADELGVTNATFRVLDAEKMDLEDDSVDRVISRWGYMLMADPAAALKETNRVLKPDGRLAFAVWATPDKNLWAATTSRRVLEGNQRARRPDRCRHRRTSQERAAGGEGRGRQALGAVQQERRLHGAGYADWRRGRSELRIEPRLVLQVVSVFLP
jgi:ubiquinone/menaquinone biosynthesis C-methylase UbiE